LSRTRVVRNDGINVHHNREIGTRELRRRLTVHLITSPDPGSFKMSHVRTSERFDEMNIVLIAPDENRHFIAGSGYNV
jgi:hypothetical protein